MNIFDVCRKVKQIKLATVVEGDLKAVSISQLPHRDVRESATPFPGLFLLTLDAYFIMLSVKQVGIKYHFFESLVGMTRPGIELWSPGLLMNTQSTSPIKLIYFLTECPHVLICARIGSLQTKFVYFVL